MTPKTFLILFILLYCSANSHKQEIHQYIISQSKSLFEKTFNNGESIWSEEVWQEDAAPDYVYGLPWLTITMTHYWNQDVNFPTGIGLMYNAAPLPSAYNKAKRYYDGWTLYFGLDYPSEKGFMRIFVWEAGE